jgi:two-component system, chemotaxis family, sensor kinase CheA
MDELLTDFLTEANESLAELDAALLRLERPPDDAATLSQIFRSVHTIKGTCGFLGLPRLERLAHAAENVLGRLRDGTLRAGPDIVTLVLAALDDVRAILGGLGATGAEPAGDDSALIAALDKATAGGQPLSGSADAAGAIEPAKDDSPGDAHADPARRASPAGQRRRGRTDDPRHPGRARQPDDPGERAGADP